MKPFSRKIIVYIATSADGFIARHDGDVEWLNRLPHDHDYGMREFYASIDTVLWGRKTYDWALDYHRKAGTKGDIFDRSVKNYIFSRRPPETAAAGTEFVRDPLEKFVPGLCSSPGKNIWMMGGGELIASFLDAGLLDEFDIHVMPVFIGEGIPLIAPRRRDVTLRLLDSKAFPDGVVRLRYAVEK